jgi:hypothetical protein
MTFDIGDPFEFSVDGLLKSLPDSAELPIIHLDPAKQAD